MSPNNDRMLLADTFSLISTESRLGDVRIKTKKINKIDPAMIQVQEELNIAGKLDSQDEM